MGLQMGEMDLQTCAVQQSSESPFGNKETEPVPFPAFQGAAGQNGSSEIPLN